MHFEWNEYYSVGVKEIDDQHKYFLKLLDELYTAMNKNRAPKILRRFFDKLVKYADKHFETEERYLNKFKCPGRAEHIREHKKLRKNIVDLGNKLDTDKIMLSFETIDFLEDWLTSHIPKFDKKYTECFHKHGLK